MMTLLMMTPELVEWKRPSEKELNIAREAISCPY